MTQRVLIVGGSPEVAPPALLKRLAASCDAIVAADRGADALAAAGLAPDVLVGDRDSVSAATLDAFSGVDSIYMPPEKDETDLRLALMEADRMTGGAGEVVLASVSGGRLDHQLGVLGALSDFTRLAPRIVEAGFEAWLLDAAHRDAWRATPALMGRTLSVISLSDPAVVSERGMHWNLDSVALPLLSDCGVSNVIESPDASVVAEKGRALVILPEL